MNRQGPTVVKLNLRLRRRPAQVPPSPQYEPGDNLRKDRAPHFSHVLQLATSLGSEQQLSDSHKIQQEIEPLPPLTQPLTPHPAITKA